VRSNVSKKEWDVIRQKVYALSGYKCEVCKGKGKKWPVECHEVWHYDDELYRQTLRCMIALCPACHRVKHIGRASICSNFDSTLKHLQNVNEWDRSYTIKYVNEQFLIWSERSKFDWTLDIEKLSNYLIDMEGESW
jgi:hypothetical protein